MPETAAPDAEPTLSIGQAAERTGLSVHALRFYERQGLLTTPVHRRADGRRLYSEWDLEWLDLCIKLRSSGMPLSAIRRYAELVRQGTGNEEDRLALLRQHQEQVAAQIAALNASLEVITFKVKLYEQSVAQGALSDPLFIAPTTPC